MNRPVTILVSPPMNLILLTLARECTQSNSSVSARRPRPPNKLLAQLLRPLPMLFVCPDQNLIEQVHHLPQRDLALMTQKLLVVERVFFNVARLANMIRHNDIHHYVRRMRDARNLALPPRAVREGGVFALVVVGEADDATKLVVEEMVSGAQEECDVGLSLRVLLNAWLIRLAFEIVRAAVESAAVLALERPEVDLVDRGQEGTHCRLVDWTVGVRQAHDRAQLPGAFDGIAEADADTLSSEQLTRILKVGENKLSQLGDGEDAGDCRSHAGSSRCM